MLLMLIFFVMHFGIWDGLYNLLCLCEMCPVKGKTSRNILNCFISVGRCFDCDETIGKTIYSKTFVLVNSTFLQFVYSICYWIGTSTETILAKLFKNDIFARTLIKCKT